MVSEKVAVVTGGNKGIGYGIVKGLCEKFQGIVYLTARDVGRGEASVAKLKGLGLNPQFYQLDITDQQSIDKFKEFIVKTHGGIDVLVNNAAIAVKGTAPEPFWEQAEKTIAINYFSLLKVCETLFAILRDSAQVLNLSSSMGHLSRIPSEELKAKLSDPTLTVSKLNKLMKREFDKEKPNRNISVNSVHPGYVDTDLTSHKGIWTTEQGARAPLYLALDAHGLKGKYVWSDASVVEWASATSPGLCNI